MGCPAADSLASTFLEKSVIVVLECLTDTIPRNPIKTEFGFFIRNRRSEIYRESHGRNRFISIPGSVWPPIEIDRTIVVQVYLQPTVQFCPKAGRNINPVI